jgi:hypothetical protein
LEKECVWYGYKSNLMGDFTFKVSSILPWYACTLQNDLNVSSSTKMCKAVWSGKRCVCLLLIVDVLVLSSRRTDLEGPSEEKISGANNPV